MEHCKNLDLRDIVYFCDIVNYKFDKIEFKKFTNNLSEQLYLVFENDN